MVEFTPIADGLLFPEGPIFTSNGTVILVEIARSTVSEVDISTGDVRVLANCGGGPNGAAIGPDGNIYVCNNGGYTWNEIRGFRVPGPPDASDYIGGIIQKVDRNTGVVTNLYDRCGENRLTAPNDIVFDSEGGFWFTDIGKSRKRDMDLGGLYYATPDGSYISEAVFPLLSPNGVGLSPEGDRVYVADTHPGRLWAWELSGPGKIRPTGLGPGGADLLWGFDGDQMLDSLAIDAEGNVCVATLVTGAISIVSASGQLRGQITLPEYDQFVTNICFGGDDLRTAFITSSGRGYLYSANWETPGLALPFNV
jgi:gluconolactonase